MENKQRGNEEVEHASLLEKAIECALNAHRGQKDKGGAPYIMHPIRLMLGMEKHEERVVAVLHDVVEDGEYDFEGLLRMGFSGEVVDAVDALTRRKGESYEDFIDRVSLNALARKVKLADLADNMDLTRIAKPNEKDRARLEKYRMAVERLKSGLR
jgi:(p)ppGpp synthase/HD superfamily hydrolase